MNNTTANRLLDKAFEGVRMHCTPPIQSKQLKKDIKQIFFLEKIVDYRFYANREKEEIYYVAEANDKYLVFKQDCKTRENEALWYPKEEVEENENL